ncbi:MAG: DNA polymerase III subunit epsilon [Pseudomonadota bacterium]
MTREIVLDTETTGLDPKDGHRVVEIGAVELINHVRSGRHYHVYINPERPMPIEAFKIHGLGDALLFKQPRFADVANAFLAFIAEDPLVIHNASFDMAMLNAEFARLGIAEMPMSRAIDTVAIARRRFPGAHASLDALCKRFGVDNSGREKHGALLDSELLADVYLELLGGRQAGLGLDQAAASADSAGGSASGSRRARSRPIPLPPRLSDDERAAHDAFVQDLGDAALWARRDASDGG